MDTKKILILAAALLILGGIYAASERMAEKKARRPQVNLAAGFDAKKAAAVTIRRPEKDTLTFTKTDGAWAVAAGDASYAADGAAVEELLEKIAGMKSATVVSKNPKNFDAFEVSDDKAVDAAVTDAGGAGMARLLFGKNGPDIFSTYVRPHGDDTVYLVPGIMKNTVDRELNDWRDKKLFALDPRTVKLYTVGGDRNVQFRKTNMKTWQAVCNGRVTDHADAAAKSAISDFASLAAADFSTDGPDTTGLDKPVRTITALLENGSKRSLFLGGDKNAFQQYAKTSRGDQVYVIEKARLDSLSPTCEDVKKSLAPPAPANVPGSDKAADTGRGPDADGKQ